MRAASRLASQPEKSIPPAQTSALDARSARRVARVVSTSGSSLSSDVAQSVTGNLGADFSRVRLHNDPEAAATATDLGALAYTFGNHVVFAPGRYNPSSHAGYSLLLHELGHSRQTSASHQTIPRWVTKSSHQAEAVLDGRAGRQAPFGSRLPPDTIARQSVPPAPPPTAAVGPVRRIIYLDANVLDQINRGNVDAANALRGLIQTADVRVSNWTHRELVVQPDLPRTATANRLLLEELHIPVEDPLPLAERVTRIADATPRSGVVGVSPRDAQYAIGAQAARGELWSFDRAFRTNPGNIRARFGLQVAAESQIPAVSAPADYRVGRRLLALTPVDIPMSGVIRPPGGGGPGGGGPGGSGPGGGGPGGSGPGGSGPGGGRPGGGGPGGGRPGGGSPGGGARATEPPATTSPPAAARPFSPPAPDLVLTPSRPATTPVVAERLRVFAALEQEASAATRFAQRIQLFSHLVGALAQALDLISTTSDIVSIAANGTILDAAQRQGDQILAQSAEADAAAQRSWDRISIVSATVQVGDAIERRDTAVLFDLSGHLGDVGSELREQTAQCDGLARTLGARGEALGRLADVYLRAAGIPQGVGTSAQASEFAMHISLQLLSGTLRAASTAYASAAVKTGFLADHLTSLAHSANQQAWSIVLQAASRPPAGQQTAPRPPGGNP